MSLKQLLYVVVQFIFIVINFKRAISDFYLLSIMIIIICDAFI